MSEQEPGAMQKAKGLAKEAAGTVMGDEEMKAEGRAEREGDEEHREGTEGNKEYLVVERGTVHAPIGDSGYWVAAVIVFVTDL